ncbi:hypothetical protein R2Q81_10465 [Microbacterium aquimaris]|uniref:hypothetical protein n=1 Tax=Microbacterium aquimaris TaxID=459816 RepID=UPI002AD2B0EB|nr:hypothetical protein [Microbacterium aquimaris]MDZ8276368.1 hypothetical protein [Microbacterium aquimaris]
MMDDTREEPFVTDDMTGVHLVETSDGTGLRVDLDARTVQTFPAPGSPLSRRRVEEVDLVLLATCRLGQPMVVLLDLEIPGVWFTRRTTEPVARIRPERLRTRGDQGR